MPSRMIAALDRRIVGRLLLAAGALGVVASLAGTVVGVRFVGQLGTALDDSIGVTAEAVDALQSTVELAATTIEGVERVLDEAESTTRSLAVALREAEQALTGVAALSEGEIAGSLAAVEESLPTLIDVAGVIDRTLSRLGALPFGPEYAPPEPFDESLRTVQREFAGLPERLEEQAALIRDAGDGLGTVRRGTTRMTDDLHTLNATLASVSQLVDRYTATAADAADVVSAGHDRLRNQLAVARVLVVALGVSMLVGQAVPLGVGWFLLHPHDAASFLTPPPD